MAEKRDRVSVEFREKGGAKVSSTFKSIAKSALAMATAYLTFTAAYNGGRDMIKLGADLDHMRTQTGMTVRGIMELSQAYEDNGIAAQMLGNTIGAMQRRITLTADGGAIAAKSLAMLRLEASELMKLSPEKQFEIIADRISKVEDPARRSAIAFEIFSEQGRKMLPLLAKGGALDDARTSLGAMPALLEKNSAQLERIDTLIGRIPNKAKQMWAGIADQASQHLLAPLEALNRIDLTKAGQRVGAFIDLAVQSFKDGTFAEFIALAIEVGFIKGSRAIHSIMNGVFMWLATDGWKQVLNGVMTFGVTAAKILIQIFEDSINYISKRMDFLLSKMPGYKSRHRDVDFSGATDFLDKNLASSRESLGIESLNLDKLADAELRLNTLIENRIALREQERAAMGGDGVSGGITEQIDKLEAVKTAWAEWSNAASNHGANAAKVLTASLDGVSASITEMLMTGQNSFRDLAKSLGAMVTNMLVKLAMLKAAMAFGVGDGGGGISSFQFGGNYGAGAPRTTGERGPEMDIPRSAGYVIPNAATDRLTQSGGSGQSVKMINIFDPDAAYQHVTPSTRDEVTMNFVNENTEALGGVFA